MFDYFKITAASARDFEHLLWLVKYHDFYPQTVDFDYRQFFILVGVDYGSRMLVVKTRTNYTLLDFNTLIIPTALWTSRYGMSVAPTVVGLDTTFVPGLEASGHGTYNDTRFVLTYGLQPYISPLIADWVEAVGGAGADKPVDIDLLLALNDLVDGMDADGNWDELDYFYVIAGMDTNTMRRRPLKTTGAATILISGTGFPWPGVQFDKMGFNGNQTSWIRLQWIPSLNGVKYTQDSASMGCYTTVFPSSTNNAYGDMGGFNSADQDSGSALRMDIIGGYPNNRMWGLVNDGNSTFNMFSSDPTDAGSLTGYRAIYRTSSTARAGYKGGTTRPGSNSTSKPLVAMDFFGGGYNINGNIVATSKSTYAMFFMGSGNVNHQAMEARMNTWLTARQVI